MSVSNMAVAIQEGERKHSNRLNAFGEDTPKNLQIFENVHSY